MGWRCDLDGVEHGRASNGTRLSRGVNRRGAGSTRRAATEDGQEVLMDWGARYVHCRQSLAWRCRAKKADIGWLKEAVAPGCTCCRYRDAMAIN
jgi:predicted NAD/FAD-dependent oxidoreductase